MTAAEDHGATTGGVTPLACCKVGGTVHPLPCPHHGSWPLPRVAFTPGSIAGVVVARKRHRCENHLTDERHYIEPGDRYVANALPPDHPDIGNPGWWHLRVCLDCCPAHYDPRSHAVRTLTQPSAH